MLHVEYEGKELRRLAGDPFYVPKRWGPDLVIAFRKVVQLVRAATDEKDLRSIRSLRLEQLPGGSRSQCSLKLNLSIALLLAFVAKGDRMVVVLELRDRQL